MDEEIISNLTEVLGRLTGSIGQTKVEFDEYGRQLSAAESRAKQIENARLAAIEKRIAEEEAAFQKSVQKWAQLSKATVSTAASMTTQAGAFKALTNVVGMVVKTLGSIMGKIPFVGAALKGLSDGAADAIQLIADTTYKAFETFGKISGSGIVSNFENMIEASKKTGLLYEELDEVLAKNSESLAAFGNTALDGSTRLQNILAINLKSNERFAEEAQKLGMSFSEFAEYQASYVAQQTKTGFLRGKDDAYIAEQARKYADELDTLSKLTGKNRKDLQKEQEKLLSDARYRAKLEILKKTNPEQAAEIDKLVRTTFSALGPEMGQGIADWFSAGGPITPASQKLALMLQQGGENGEDLIRLMNSGTGNISEVFQRMMNASKKYVDKTKDLAVITADGNMLTANYLEAANLAARSNKSIDEILKEIKDKKEEIKKQADPMAQAATKSHEVANRMQLMLTSTKAVPAAVDFLAARIKDFGKFLDDQFKDKKLSGLDAQDAENWKKATLKEKAFIALAKSVEKTGEAIGKTFTWLGADTVGEGITKVSHQAKAARIQSDTEYLQKTGRGSTSPAHDPVGSGAPGAPELTKISSKSGPSTMVGKQFAGTFQTLIDYLDKQNYKIYSLGGYVDRDVRGQPGVKSVHARGAAIDINPAENPMGPSLITDMPPNISKVAAGLGLGWGGNWSSVKDAMHFSAASNEGGKLLQAANGALVEPKPGGTLVQVAEAGKPEAIVPLPNGRSIPVTITNQQNDMLVDNLSALSSKFDSIIDLLAKNNNIKGNLMQALV